MKNLGKVIDLKDISRKKDIPTTIGFTVGDEINHTLRNNPPENFICFDNFFNIRYDEYTELAGVMSIENTSEFYWEEIKPNVECFSFDKGNNQGIGSGKVEESNFASIIRNLIGGLYRADKWDNRYFSEITDDSTNPTDCCMYIMLKGSVIEEILSNNEPVLILCEFTTNRQRYRPSGQIIYGNGDGITGGTPAFLHGGTNIANVTQSSVTWKFNYDFINYVDYVSGGYNFNTFAWDSIQLENNTYNQNPVKDMTRLGIVLSFQTVTKYIVPKNFKIFRRVRGAGELYIDLPPFYFVPQYKNMSYYNYQNESGSASSELSLGIGIKKYLGKKNN